MEYVRLIFYEMVKYKSRGFKINIKTKWVKYCVPLQVDKKLSRII